MEFYNDIRGRIINELQQHWESIPVGSDFDNDDIITHMRTKFPMYSHKNDFVQVKLFEQIINDFIEENQQSVYQDLEIISPEQSKKEFVLYVLKKYEVNPFWNTTCIRCVFSTYCKLFYEKFKSVSIEIIDEWIRNERYRISNENAESQLKRKRQESEQASKSARAKLTQQGLEDDAFKELARLQQPQEPGTSSAGL
jgi:hypothetical protein